MIALIFWRGVEGTRDGFLFISNLQRVVQEVTYIGRIYLRARTTQVFMFECFWLDWTHQFVKILKSIFAVSRGRIFCPKARVRHRTYRPHRVPCISLHLLCGGGSSPGSGLVWSMQKRDEK